MNIYVVVAHKFAYEDSYSYNVVAFNHADDAYAFAEDVNQRMINMGESSDEALADLVRELDPKYESFYSIEYDVQEVKLL